jgi:hypothetical protein
VIVRSVRFRALALLPILAAAAVTLSACDSKAGYAAVVNGTKISEKSLNSYLTPNTPPVSASDGSSTPPRLFALNIAVQGEVVARVLAATNIKPSVADLDKALSTAGATVDQLNDTVIKAGFTAKFTPVYQRVIELSAILQGKFTTAATQQAAISKAALNVSVSPRYGVWDGATLAISALGKKNLPDMLTLNTVLPGDASAAAAQ